MSDKTQIEWTDATWNPIRGCSRVSEGCRNCYAERVAGRFSGPGLPYEGLTRPTSAGPVWTGDIKLIERHLEDPLRWQRPRKIFVNSMSDLFHENVPDEWIRRVFDIMERAHQHTFQILTKRPERMSEFVCSHYGTGSLPPPLPNVWLGVSIEDTETARERIPLLLECSAPVLFVSAEPLLDRVKGFYIDGVDWVIVGGESGPGARPMREEWVSEIHTACTTLGVPFFFKQWGEFGPNGARVGKKAAGRELRGRTWDEFPKGVRA